MLLTLQKKKCHTNSLLQQQQQQMLFYWTYFDDVIQIKNSLQMYTKALDLFFYLL